MGRLRNKTPRGATKRTIIHPEKMPERGVVDVRDLYPGVAKKHRQPNGAPLWEQWPGESEIEFLHFTIYRDMGIHRSLNGARIIALSMTKEELEWMEKNFYKEYQMLRSKGGLSVSTRLKWGWQERCLAYDQHQDRRLGRIASDQELSNLEQLKMAQELREKGLSKIRATPTHRLSIRDSQSLIDLANRWEASVRGLPNPEVEALKGKDILDLTKLTAEELELVISIVDKISNKGE